MPMKVTRSVGTFGRLFQRYGFIGLCSALAGVGFVYGCAGTNTDYAGNVVDAGTDDAGGPPDFTCVKMPDEDLPDEAGLDTDCDGIDGSKDWAIFVSPMGDDANLGTMESPVKTVTKALALASTNNKHGVYLSAGTYPESVKLVDGIGIYGGYDAASRWQRLMSNKSIISGGVTAITATGLTKQTEVQQVTIRSANGAAGSAANIAGQSSYGVFAVNNTGLLVLRSNTIVAGDGGAGGLGATGATAVTGVNNGNGTDGQGGVSGGSNGGGGGAQGNSACGRAGGAGGSGSQGNSGGGGAEGTNNPGSGGGGGSKSSICGSNASGGGRGGNGANGTNGGIGPAAASFGTATAAGYNPASGGSGTGGSAAAAGGGGGAGGGGVSTLVCKSDTGGGGGGGGAGGCPGGGGVGGGGGGGSIGVYAFGSKVLIANCAITTGKGGDGGNGGAGTAGSVGGTGGKGGGGADDAAGGGDGGNGGKGGDAGAGAGGTGGPSFGMWTVKSTLDQATANNTYPATGGAGRAGAGGTSPLGAGPGGQNGLAASTRIDP